MRHDMTRPVGTRAEYNKDSMYFGVCDTCGDIGVKLLKYNGWNCHRCAYSQIASKIDEINPSH